ncbi:YceI family protein [Olivibacter sp. CPCC 100613]|uniref:YceI family protein n=1 Tax=Olivibacter sp. CPCC 100613 TaxID=3079931 RepID=UPI002FF85BE3
MSFTSSTKQRLVGTLVLTTFLGILSAFTYTVRTEHHLVDNSLIKSKNAVNYKIDQQKSKITWLAKKVSGEHSGEIKIASGNLNFDGQHLIGGDFILDTRSISVTDVKDKETNGKLVGHLKNDDFFAVEKFPEARFVITNVKKKSDGLYDVQGNLTIKGITKPISFSATTKVVDQQIVANAKIRVNRTDYGIKFRSTNFFENLGDKAIYDDFDLQVNLVANR